MRRGPFTQIADTDAIEMQVCVYGSEERVPSDLTVRALFHGEWLREHGISVEQATALLERLASQIYEGLQLEGGVFARGEVRELGR